MKKNRILFAILLTALILSGCAPVVAPDDPEPVSVVTQHGIRMEVLEASMHNNDLLVEFLIDHDPAVDPAYRLRMPWFVEDLSGQRIESSHSAFYHVFDEDGAPVPGRNRLTVTFRDFPGSPDKVHINARIEPNFLVPSQDGYTFEVPLEDMTIDAAEPTRTYQLGFWVTAAASMVDDNTLAVSIRMESSEELLSTLTYAVQPFATDNHGQVFVSYRSRRESEQEGLREETIYFDDFPHESSTVSVRYPIDVKASRPEQINFEFTHIPVDEITG